MMKTQHFFFSFLLLASIIGCSKDTDEPDPSAANLSGKLKLVWKSPMGTDALTGSETFHYDAEGRLSKWKIYNSPEYDKEEHLSTTHTYVYNRTGQLESITVHHHYLPNKVLQIAQVTLYVYKANGEIDHEYQANMPDQELYTYYTYKDGLVTEKNVYSDAEHQLYTIRYTYNEAGQPVLKENFSPEGERRGKTVYTYENGLNTVEEWYIGPGDDRLGTRIIRGYGQDKKLQYENYNYVDPATDGIFEDRNYVYF